MGPPQGPLFWESSLSLWSRVGPPTPIPTPILLPSGPPHSHPGKGSRLVVSLLEPWIPETKDSFQSTELPERWWWAGRGRFSEF